MSFLTEINYQVRTVSNEAKESSSNSEKWHKFLNEGTEYISTTEPRVFPGLYVI